MADAMNSGKSEPVTVTRMLLEGVLDYLWEREMRDYFEEEWGEGGHIFQELAELNHELNPEDPPDAEGWREKWEEGKVWPSTGEAK